MTCERCERRMMWDDDLQEWVCEPCGRKVAFDIEHWGVSDGE